MGQAFESRWKRIFGYILESEHVKNYTIPDNPYVSASSNDKSEGCIIAYSELQFLTSGIAYKIKADFHYEFEDNQDKHKFFNDHEVDPPPSSSDKCEIRLTLQRCTDKLGNEFKSYMKGIL